jgi:hypothetical protein
MEPWIVAVVILGLVVAMGMFVTFKQIREREAEERDGKRGPDDR